jgi:hypothetical protein
MESLTLKIIYPKRKNILCTCIYRSNGILPGVTRAQQLERFFIKFDELLHNISQINLASLVFMDSNIDLLNLNADSSSNFLDSIISKGYLQCIFKATRFENESKTLIDNILYNQAGPLTTGTILSDISDHFFTFLQLNHAQKKKVEKTYTVKQFTENNLNNFKLLLGGTDWRNVTESMDVDAACNEFWTIYSNLFNLTFPEKTVRFNKKIHCKQPFMSAGLLKSRENKDRLYYESLTDASPESKNRYRTYRQIYLKQSELRKNNILQKSCVIM